MAKDAVERLERTVLFQTLYKREKEAGEGHEISERVKAVVAHVAPLLERVPERMPEFTLHDPNHGAKVVELMAQILPADTRERLNVVELSTLIYAAYLHDLGMTCSADEREQLIKGDAEFARLLAADESRSLLLQQLREGGEHRAATAVEDQVFTEYLRRTHVRRSARFIDEHLADGELMIGWQGVSYARWVRAVCDSHALPVSRLRDEVTWPRNALVRTLRVNVQYLALILRLADILDLDPERTPKVLLDFIDPKDPQSVVEWHKHRSVIGWEITPERIRVEAVCRHPVYERALREFLGWIEEERRDSMLLASRYKDDIAELYHLDLRDPVVQERVTSDGSYIYSDLKFNIDYRRVLNLLMGERLYGNPVVALRELLQNSVDAVRHREALAARADEPFEPSIAVRLADDKLIIEDNGVGMDEHIVKNYFMQVGRSYYRSPEFRAAQLDIDPVSEFGIGILSVFMVADRCEIESRRHPDDPLHPEPPIKIEIPTAYDYFVQRPTERSRIGTTIILALKPGHPFESENLLNMIGDLAPFIEYPITVQTETRTLTYQPLKAGEPLLTNNGVERILTVPLEMAEDSHLNGIRGRLYVIKHEEYKYDMTTRWGIIAQRGFMIGGPASYADGDNYSVRHQVKGEMASLLPSWLKTEASIDLREEAKLTLTPDRGDAIRNEQFRRIKAGIEKQVLKALKKHLQAEQHSLPLAKYHSYVIGLFEKGVLNTYPPEVNDELRALLLDFVPFSYVTSRGETLECYGRSFVNTGLVAFTSVMEWPDGVSEEQVYEAFKNAISSTDVRLLCSNDQHSPQNALLNEVYGRETGYLITSIPGVVFDLRTSSPEVPPDLYSGTMVLTRGVLSPASQRAPVLLHGSTPSYLTSPVFNALHPLLAPYVMAVELQEYGDDNILQGLSDRVGEVFEELSNSPALSRKLMGNKYIDRYSYPNIVLTGVLNWEPHLVDSLRSAFEEFWQEAKRAGAMGADLPFPGLTAEDLPWFWSYEGEAAGKKSRGGRGKKR
jgi:molecular chaperone HtpG